MAGSIVQWYAEHESHRCGYCGRADTNHSHGMWAHSLAVGDYQDLIDRGWRRSGMYCYKPTMDVTCCPMYTIRCRALDFKPSKSQKKILKKFNKSLMGLMPSENDQSQRGDRKMSTGSTEETAEGGGDDFVESSRGHSDIDVNSIINVKSTLEETEGEVNSAGAETSTKLEEQSNNVLKNKSVKQGLGLDKSKGPCKKAKQLRLERKMEKLREKGIELNTIQSVKISSNEKQLEDFFNEIPNEVQKKLEVRLIRTTPPSPEWLATAKETHQVYVKYQMAVHGDKPEKCSEPKFKDFLVKSPLMEEHSDSGPDCGYGSFHQQYWLQGKLVAVGVVDVLPKCVSSVYFFYDPSYRHLTFGSYGALRELAFTRELQKSSPQLKYYYMGFYIHSCRKMRYKGNFAPSDLLCPETYKWFPLKDCIPKLEVSPYSRLDPDIDSTDENHSREKDLDKIPLLVGSTVIPFKYYKKKISLPRDEVVSLLEYAKLVGAKSAESMIFVRYASSKIANYIFRGSVRSEAELIVC